MHQDQVCHSNPIWPTRVPLPKKQICADTVIARTPLPSLRYPVGAITPPLLKRQKSTTKISCKSDIVKVLPLSKAGGDKNVPQPKDSGDHNIPQHQKATFEIAKRFTVAIIFTKTLWPIISHEKYSMVDEAWKLSIQPQNHHSALAGASVVTLCVCQLPSGPSPKINRQTVEAISVYSVFCSSIGLMMIRNPKKYILNTND